VRIELGPYCMAGTVGVAGSTMVVVERVSPGSTTSSSNYISSGQQ
jgi:hypothetical protein